MKVITRPEVYLLGRQILVHGELQRFLADHDFAEWTTDSPSDAETLVEVAARTCYQSFRGGRPHAEHVEHILEVGHGCYDIDTEVLTLGGWKFWPDVTIDDKFATICPETHEIEYQSPTKLIKYEYTGRMYRVDGQQVNLLVTPNHKMLVCKTGTLEGRKKQNYSLISAEEIGSASHAYLKSGIWKGGSWGENCPGRDIFALLGFAIGDGSMSQKSSASIRFRLRRERKIIWLKTLCDKLKDRGVSFEHTHKDKYIVRLPNSDKLIRRLFGNIYDKNRNKQIPLSSEVFANASKEGLQGLFEGLMQSDGSVNRTSSVFDTTSKTLADQFQQLCLHIGLAANIQYVYNSEQRSSSFGKKDLIRLGVIYYCLRPEINKWVGAYSKTSWIEDWNGDVFCAEVPNHTLYVRRGGLPVWSGNSVTEHAVWNILCTGISRSLTHELIRHRAGASPSQLSQRFVDESVAEYVEPEIIAKDPELHLIWLESVAQSHAAYLKLVDKLNQKMANPLSSVGMMIPIDADRTTRRKASRQAARSVLPNATETKVFLTLNARAARHMIEMRTSRHADHEIRLLFNRIWEVLKEEAPNLFGDYVKTELVDGTFELTTSYKKV